jgi:aldehyde reductase
LAKKYKKSPGQILLRHLIQQNIAVIPKSTNAQRIRDNFNLFDFNIDEADMKKFDEEKEDIRLFSFSL